jgi:uncharacterized protein (TIGR02996 family)
MNERDAILAGIRANPNDDVYRLAYADWCDEQSRRVWDSVVAVRAEIIETMGSETHCNYCGIDTRPYHEHVVTCLVRKLWTDEDELKRSPDYARQCVQVATAEYIRLTCDVPKKGPGKNLAMWRADEWLRANWKRLVPTLTTEFDNFPDEYLMDDVEPPQESPLLSNTWRVGTWTRWTKATRGELSAGIPITPKRDYGPARTYVCAVKLTFSRGFVARASWQAPSLGPRILEMIEADQPLADVYGPGVMR